MGSLVDGYRMCGGITNRNCCIVYFFLSENARLWVSNRLTPKKLYIENQKIKIMEASCHFPVNLAQCYNAGEFVPDWRWFLACKLEVATII